MGDKSCNRREISGSAGASAEVMSGRETGEKGGEGGKRVGERGSIRIRDMTTRRSLSGADRLCGTRMQLGSQRRFREGQVEGRFGSVPCSRAMMRKPL